MENQKAQKMESEHNFLREYTEMIKNSEMSMEEIEENWIETGGHIQKYSRLDQTPPPILTDHTTPLECWNA